MSTSLPVNSSLKIVIIMNPNSKPKPTYHIQSCKYIAHDYLLPLLTLSFTFQHAMHVSTCCACECMQCSTCADVEAYSTSCTQWEPLTCSLTIAWKARSGLKTSLTRLGMAWPAVACASSSSSSFYFAQTEQYKCTQCVVTINWAGQKGMHALTSAPKNAKYNSIDWAVRKTRPGHARLQHHWVVLSNCDNCLTAWERHHLAPLAHV